jgi:hypothetical protein
MPTITKQLLYWAPRLLGIVFILFVSTFALDVFSEHLPFPRTILALVIHLIPTAIMTALLIVSWRWEWVGGVGFVALALLYIEMMGGLPRAYPIIFGPGLLIGILFLVSWVLRTPMRRSSTFLLSIVFLFGARIV